MAPNLTTITFTSIAGEGSLPLSDDLITEAIHYGVTLTLAAETANSRTFRIDSDNYRAGTKAMMAEANLNSNKFIVDGVRLTITFA